MKRYASPQSGFTLLELLLVVGVAAMLMLGAAQMVRSWANTQSAKAAGNQLQAIALTTERFVADHWGTMPATADVLTNPMWNELLNILAESGLYDLNTGQIPSPVGAPLRIAFQIEGTPPDRFFRTVIYSTRPMPNNKVMAAARNGGPTAGVWTRFPDDVNARGAYNQWIKDVAFLTTPTGDAGTLLGQPPSDSEGYLISMTEVSESQAIGPYLYRTDMDNPALNTMGADLDMGGRAITGLGNLETATLNVTDTANFNNMNVAGDTQFPNGMTVDGDMISTGSLSVAGDTSFASPMSVQGLLTAQSLNVGTLQTSQIAANGITTNLLSINNGQMIVDGSLNLGGGSLTAGTLNAVDCVYVAGEAFGDAATCP